MKKRRKKLYLSNDGFSLMELVVTILVSAVVTAAVAGFLSAGMRYYWNADHETKLQTESQVTSLFVTELIQESTDYREIPASARPADVSKAYEIKREGLTYVLILKGNQLWFSEVPDPNPNPNPNPDAEKIQKVIDKKREGAFLADHVSFFHIMPAKRTNALTDTNGVVTVNMTFDINGKEFADKLIISLRNKKKN